MRPGPSIQPPVCQQHKQAELKHIGKPKESAGGLPDVHLHTGDLPSALTFAADAAPMGIQWRFGTRVRVGVGIFGRWIGHFGGLIADGERRYVEDLGVSLVMRSGEASTDTRLT